MHLVRGSVVSEPFWAVDISPNRFKSMCPVSGPGGSLHVLPRKRQIAGKCRRDEALRWKRNGRLCHAEGKLGSYWSIHVVQSDLTVSNANLVTPGSTAVHDVPAGYEITKQGHVGRSLCRKTVYLTLRFDCLLMQIFV